ncbi:SR-related and CTD-associated factor 4-like isoform X2 [Saccostrea echinata]|uniref:SR-related and CTD-associated factor 4-like isoform X2 n=1 Tax=Saccostrea echinata TaxID=191078 RepID=UPI002A833A5E|nr:SR-related and CTD-associated factor 4-like isoform X2 [Saccostrea echinata]
MEAVRAFNNELSSLYETRPPISRAKMANVTKCAIKAIKFYKHVVQSVEKFILKCKPEYKVPGLYVIDSIVRQSRHQFGQEKDVFAPRFTKNIVATFQNLFKCPPEERSKVVRVLNLWQKNGVFMSEVIQPLLDMAADPNNQQFAVAAQRAVDNVMATGAKPHHAEGGQDTSMNTSLPPEEVEENPENSLAAQTEMLNTVTQLLQQTSQGSTSLSAQQQQLQQLQLLQQQLIQHTQLMQQPSQGTPVIDSNLLSHIQTLTNQLLKSGDKPPEPGFNRKLLDFDYGESDEEDAGQHSQPSHNMLNETHMMQQIQQLSQTIQKNEELNRQKILQQQQAEFDQQIGHMGGMPPQMHMQHDPLHHQMGHQMPQGYGHIVPAEQPQQIFPPQDIDERPHLPPGPPPEEEEDQRDRRDRDREDRRHRRSRHERSRSRTPKKRRRSRSRSRDRRRRSRSRERHRRSRSRDRERDRQREKERERRKKGLPQMKDQCLSICSTTLFIGKISKTTSEDELRTELEKFGSVDSINMIPPRGCAFVCMTRRKEASKAVDRMKGLLLNGSELRVAWAPGIGVKESMFKDKWDVEVGATYIPWSDLPEDLSGLIEGGIIDEDSLPENLKGMTLGREKPDAVEEPPQQQQPLMNSQMPPTQAPPLQPVNMPPGGPPPGTMPPPMPSAVMPQGMLPRMNMMPQMVMQGGMPPPQISGMPPAVPSAPMSVSTGIPPLPGQAGMIPLPAGMPPGGMPQVVRQPASVVTTGIPFTQNMPTMGTQPMLAVQRPGLPPAATFQRFPLPPQGFLRPPQPNFDPMKPAMPGSNRPPFDAGQEPKDKPPMLGQDWQQKSDFNAGESMDLEEPETKPGKKSRFSDATPPDPFSSQGGPPVGPGIGMIGQMRPPMGGGMGPPGGMRGPRPLMDAGGPNMGPRGPPEGQNRFNSPNMMGGPQRGGFGGPGGPPGFRGNRPFQRFPGQFMRPGFRGPPGDMMRPPFEGPGGEEGNEMDKPIDDQDSDHKRRNSGDRWRDDRDDDRDGGDYRDYRRDDWRGGRGRGRGRDFGGRGGRRDFDRRDRNRDDRGGRDRDYDRDRDRRNRDRGDSYRDRDDGYRSRDDGFRDRGRDRDREDRGEWHQRTEEERSNSRKEALGWGSALEEMMKNVVIPPPGGKSENTDKGPAEEIGLPPAAVPPPPKETDSAGQSSEPEPVAPVEPVASVEPVAAVEPVAPVEPASKSVKINGPEVTSKSVPNGEELTSAPESDSVTEKKEKVAGDLEEGEIE